MTLPDERYRAVTRAQKFLTDLAFDRKKYPRIPKSVRQEAYSILRHYPSDYDMDRAASSAPAVFQPHMDPLHRLLLVYEENKNESGT